MKLPSLFSLWCVFTVVSTGATVCAWATNRLLERRQSAALRHFISFLALTAPLLAVPIFSLPTRVRIPVFAASGPVPAGANSIQPEPVVAGTQATSATSEPRRPVIPPPPGDATRVWPAFTAFASHPWSALWLGVSGALLIRLYAGTNSVVRTVEADCVPAGADLLLRLRKFSVARRRAHLPRLFVSRTHKVPFCCGLLRPDIVIPVGIVEEKCDLLDYCLQHELAHIVRRDLLLLFVAYLGCALCWFNPLMWLTLRRLRDEAEAAADDRVLAHQSDPGHYAAGLLSIAEAGGHRAAPALAFSMARPNRLRDRVIAILDATLPRRAPTRGTVAALGTLAVLTLYVSLSVRLVAAEPTPGPAAGEKPGLPYESGTFKVRVSNAQGQAIQGAKVLADNCFSNGTGQWWCDPTTGERASSLLPGFPTGADGEATVPYPIYLGGTNHELRTVRVSYHVRADGYCEATGKCEVSTGTSSVKLVKGTVVTLRATSPEGEVLPKPRAVLGHADTYSRWMDWRHAPDETALVSISAFTPGSHFVMAVTADAAGVLSFSEIKEFTADETVPELTLALPVHRGRDVSGALDASVPRPVRDGRVIAFVIPEGAKGADGTPIKPSWKACTAIRADGTFTLANLPPGELHVTALCDGSVTANEEHEITVAPQVFAADAALPLVLKMEPTGDVRVKAFQADGAPMVGAGVGFNPNENCDFGVTTILGNAYGSVADFDVEYNEKFPSHEELAETRVRRYKARTDDKGEVVIFDLPTGKKPFWVTDASGHAFERTVVGVQPGTETAATFKAP